MSTGKLMGTSIFTAIAASLCCITPVLALIAGSGSIASSFSWIEPARPYMIGITIAVLGLAWYQKLKPQPTDECGCAIDDLPGSKAGKSKFFQSKNFLFLITIFSSLMIAFPFYAKAFFPKKEKTAMIVDKSNIKTVEVNIKGMTCEACEEHVKHALNKLNGIIESKVSFKNKNAVIRFDISKISIKEITGAVNKTGYKVVNYSIKN